MSFTATLKRLLVGRKLDSGRLGEQTLPKRLALPVLASDALSSVAYAPDEILITLSLAGMATIGFSWQIGIAVAVVMLVVVMSYRQTVHAYPNGGGGYEVARQNLGTTPSLIVASALLVDYSLTVAVSVASGVQNAKAALPWLNDHEVTATLAIIALITLMNLRGVRDSGAIFAIPTYCFMLGIASMAITGAFRTLILGHHLESATTHLTLVAVPPFAGGLAGMAGVFLLMRAFAGGSSALTGVEAISNSVPNFREPKAKNAATTLLMLGGIAVTMLMSILWLVNTVHVKLVDVAGGAYLVDASGTRVTTPVDTVIGQLANAVFGRGTIPFYFVVIATMVILFVAANTAFNGFPSLASILARDSFLPHQLHLRGDRLAFSNGILVLAALAGAIVVFFGADVTAMIQLYVVGVFMSFTISQAGLIKHWTTLMRNPATEAHARKRAMASRAINMVGLVLTAIVLVVVLIAKFTHGAWIALLAMAAMFGIMRAIHSHYGHVKEALRWRPREDDVLPSRVHNVVLISQVNRPTVRAVQFAKATGSSTCEALTVAVDPGDTERLVAEWDDADFGIPLKVLASPFREITGPVLNYVRQRRSDNPRDVVCVFIPEFVERRWWDQLLHNQTALMIKARLHFMAGVMITSVPYQPDAGPRHTTGVQELV